MRHSHDATGGPRSSESTSPSSPGPGPSLHRHPAVGSDDHPLHPAVDHEAPGLPVRRFRSSVSQMKSAGTVGSRVVAEPRRPDRQSTSIKHSHAAAPATRHRVHHPIQTPHSSTAAEVDRRRTVWWWRSPSSAHPPQSSTSRIAAAVIGPRGTGSIADAALINRCGAVVIGGRGPRTHPRSRRR